MSSQPGLGTAVTIHRDNSRKRTSEVLRGILEKNPGVRTFTIERILDAIGQERVEASLMVFSLPAIVPVQAPRDLVTLPLGSLGCQMATGRKHLGLPASVLRKSVSRRSLAVALHAIAPILEAAERLVKPRLRWMTHPVARRAIGVLVFLLAVAIAYPLVGGNALHAMSVFVVSLGLAEQDGLAVLIGLVAGVASLAVVAASGWSLRALGLKVRDALRSAARKLGMNALSSLLERLGFGRLGRLLSFEVSDLVLLWDPESHAVAASEPALVVQAVHKGASSTPTSVAPWTAPRPSSAQARRRPARSAETGRPPWASRPLRAA